MPKPVQNINISKVVPLIAPRKLCAELPASPKITGHVFRSRETVKNILAGKDPRLLAVVGPCSIHDVKAALEYAKRLNTLRKKLGRRLFIVMRVYFEKPRTTLGWKGLIADPYLDGSADMPQGLRIARKLLLDINAMGLPAATEMLDPIVPQYTADLISWAAIGARTTESQTHREMASGLSMPVGFKNSTDGNLQIPMDALASARHPHSFLGINSLGQTAVIRTKGNPDVHIILRGGKNAPNYGPRQIRETETRLSEAGLPPAIMVDCSHANSGKRAVNQEKVLRNILRQRQAGRRSIIGFMLESNLLPGSQGIPVDLTDLKYGISVTDECLGWEKTEKLLSRAGRRNKT
jgi:3-deoxy-7-phosphoheptulonate synthase